MKPLRKNVALAIDGGGIKGVIVTRALSILEKAIGAPLDSFVNLCAGTSTGAIISAGVACGLTADHLYKLYVDLGKTIFKSSWRTALFPLSRYRYPIEPLAEALRRYLGNPTLGDIWEREPRIDLVLTTFDIVTNKTRFVKPWKSEYKSWPLIQAVLASSVVPTYFPVVSGRYIDGGVGAYANPCYLAAYEALNYLQWDPAETTLVSLGTGREPHYRETGEADRWYAWQWIAPVLGAFLQSSDDQQVAITERLFPNLDFRRFQVDLLEPIEMDNAEKIPDLIRYGEQLGQKILRDETETAPDFVLGQQPEIR
jgi:patatin-like phospholipase/acyl hydrolase